MKAKRAAKKATKRGKSKGSAAKVAKRAKPVSGKVARAAKPASGKAAKSATSAKGARSSGNAVLLPHLRERWPRTEAERKARAAEYYARLIATYPDAHCALDHADAYQLLVATILS